MDYPSEYCSKRRQTRTEIFLGRMESLLVGAGNRTILPKVLELLGILTNMVM
jgi:hypothetical protein